MCPAFFSDLAIQMAAAIAVNAGQDLLSRITSTPANPATSVATGAIGKFIRQAYERPRLGSNSATLLKFMGAVLCVYETTRARLPRVY